MIPEIDKYGKELTSYDSERLMQRKEQKPRDVRKYGVKFRYKDSTGFNLLRELVDRAQKKADFNAQHGPVKVIFSQGGNK